MPVSSDKGTLHQSQTIVASEETRPLGPDINETHALTHSLYDYAERHFSRFYFICMTQEHLTFCRSKKPMDTLFLLLGNVGVATGFALAQGDVGGVAVDDGGELLAQIDTVE